MTAQILLFTSRKYWEKQEIRAHFVTVVATLHAPSAAAALALFASGQGLIVESKLHDAYDPREPSLSDTIAVPCGKLESWEVHHTSARYVTFVQRVIAASRDDAETRFHMGRGTQMASHIGDEIPPTEHVVEEYKIVESATRPN